MLCVIAKIDEDSRQKLNALCRCAEQYGASPKNLYGHITLATYLDADECALVSECKDILQGRQSFRVLYDKIEVFPASSMIAAVPSGSEMLSSVHDSLISVQPDLLNDWTRNPVWQPHTTLAYLPGCDLDPMAHAMRALFSPFTARIQRIEFSRVTDSGYEIVDTVVLEE